VEASPPDSQTPEYLAVVATASRRTAIYLVAGRKTSGEAVFEEVLVTREGASHYRIEATPGLVLGVARGDLIEYEEESKSFVVLERGGNLAVHVYGPHAVAERVAEEVEKLGGSLDGRARDLTVFTVPAAVGFPAVEELFNGLAAADEGVHWYFGNVYDPADGVTPLDWWD
jgi:hypothetical protein